MLTHVVIFICICFTIRLVDIGAILSLPEKRQAVDIREVIAYFKFELGTIHGLGEKQTKFWLKALFVKVMTIMNEFK